MKLGSPSGTPCHRQHFAEVARSAAFGLAQSLGTGELDGELYRGLPVGDCRAQDVLSKFLGLVESQALELFDRAVAARDLPDAHNVVTMKRKRT